MARTWNGSRAKPSRRGHQVAAAAARFLRRAITRPTMIATS